MDKLAKLQKQLRDLTAQRDAYYRHDWGETIASDKEIDIDIDIFHHECEMREVAGNIVHYAEKVERVAKEVKEYKELIKERDEYYDNQEVMGAEGFCVLSHESYMMDVACGISNSLKEHHA